MCSIKEAFVMKISIIWAQLWKGFSHWFYHTVCLFKWLAGANAWLTLRHCRCIVQQSKNCIKLHCWLLTCCPSLTCGVSCSNLNLSKRRLKVKKQPMVVSKCQDKGMDSKISDRSWQFRGTFIELVTRSKHVAKDVFFCQVNDSLSSPERVGTSSLQM